MVEWHSWFSFRAKVASAGSFDDQARSDFLMYLDYFAMGYLMAYDIMEKNPRALPKVVNALKQMDP